MLNNSPLEKLEEKVTHPRIYIKEVVKGPVGSSEYIDAATQALRNWFYQLIQDNHYTAEQLMRLDNKVNFSSAAKISHILSFSEKSGRDVNVGLALTLRYIFGLDLNAVSDGRSELDYTASELMQQVIHLTAKMEQQAQKGLWQPTTFSEGKNIASDYVSAALKRIPSVIEPILAERGISKSAYEEGFDVDDLPITRLFTNFSNSSKQEYVYKKLPSVKNFFHIRKWYGVDLNKLADGPDEVDLHPAALAVRLQMLSVKLLQQTQAAK